MEPTHKLARFYNNGRFLFVLILIAQVSFYVWVVASHRLPSSHDSFAYFSLQYFFLNNAVFSKEIAQWMPMITHGTVANAWYIMSAGFINSALFLIAPVLKGINFYYIFNLGMFFDELVLLIGCWLWAHRFFKQKFVIFCFSAGAVASASWFHTPWQYLHAYYCLPLVLYFLHRWMDTARSRYLFLAGNLFIISLLGNLTYFWSSMLLAIILYLAFYLMFYKKELMHFEKSVSWWKLVVAILCLAVFAVMYYKITAYGTQELIYYDFGHTMEHCVPILYLFLGFLACWALEYFLNTQHMTQPRWLILTVLVFALMASIYSFKYQQAKMQSVDASLRMQSFQFAPTTYTPRRDAHLFPDILGRNMRIDHWLKSFDQFLRYYWGRGYKDMAKNPKGMDLSEDQWQSLQWAGVSQDKVQFFPWAPQIGHERMRVPIQYQIKDFSANHLSLALTDAHRPAGWLYYADAWHPLWKAFVDGKPVDVHQSAMAYKAVEVPQNAKTVRFDFHDLKMALTQWFLSWNALAWVLIVFYFTGLHLKGSKHG